MEVPENGEVHSENEQPQVVNGLHSETETETESEDDQVVPQNVPENEPSTESEDEQVVPQEDQVVPQMEPEGDQVVPQIQPEGEQVAPQDNVRVMKEISEDDWNQMLKKVKFTKEDMNMLVMDFFVGKELPNVAQVFHAESGCPLGIDNLSVLETQKTVRNLIMNKQFDEAISLIIETQTTVYFYYWPRLKFYLEQQKMIELCHKRDFTSALNYSRKFVEWYKFKGLLFAADDFRKECLRTLLLVLYGDNAESPVANLLHPTRKSYIATYVVDKIIEFDGRKTGNGVERAMKMLRFDECFLNHFVKFPNFNTESGFPQSLPNPNKDFRNLFEGFQE